MTPRYLSSDQDRQTNFLLPHVAEPALAEGIELAGVVPPLRPGAAQGKGDRVLRLLPDGPIRDTSSDLGPGADACRLDALALEAEVLVVEDRLIGAMAQDVSKLGEHEAAGRRLARLISRACAEAISLPVGAAPEGRDTFRAFAAGAAKPLPAERDQIIDLAAPHLPRANRLTL